MKRIKLGIIFGGTSSEHNVSNISGTSIIKNLNKKKYEIIPIYISKDGKWYYYTKDIEKIDVLKIDEEINEKEEITNIIKELKKLDLVFPVLHGKNGEDGTIQGMLEIYKIPYIGCNVLSSAIGMDKVYTKAIANKANINQVKYIVIKIEKNVYSYVNKNFDEIKLSLEKLCKKTENYIGYPVYVKPSNSGSSVGVKKAKTREELVKAIEYAKKYDRKILIEEGINAREIECAILENEKIICSDVLGEIIPTDEFYNFDEKYKNSNSKIEIPANLPKEQERKIKDMAIKIFKAIDGRGISRVDFFIERESGKIYFNEINTMPGFTGISMYPKLFENSGIKYEKLLDKIIQGARA